MDPNGSGRGGISGFGQGYNMMPFAAPRGGRGVVGGDRVGSEGLGRGAAGGGGVMSHVVSHVRGGELIKKGQAALERAESAGIRAGIR